MHFKYIIILSFNFGRDLCAVGWCELFGEEFYRFILQRPTTSIKRICARCAVHIYFFLCNIANLFRFVHTGCIFFLRIDFIIIIGKWTVIASHSNIELIYVTHFTNELVFRSFFRQHRLTNKIEKIWVRDLCFNF